MNKNLHNDIPDLDSLIARYRQLPQTQPERALDDHIYKVAEKPIKSPKFGTKWPILLATAATLVVAINLGWQLNRSPTASWQEPPSELSRDLGKQQTNSTPVLKKSHDFETAPAKVEQKPSGPKAAAPKPTTQAAERRDYRAKSNDKIVFDSANIAEKSSETTSATAATIAQPFPSGEPVPQQPETAPFMAAPSPAPPPVQSKALDIVEPVGSGLGRQAEADLSGITAEHTREQLDNEKDNNILIEEDLITIRNLINNDEKFKAKKALKKFKKKWPNHPIPNDILVRLN